MNPEKGQPTEPAQKSFAEMSAQDKISSGLHLDTHLVCIPKSFTDIWKNLLQIKVGTHLQFSSPWMLLCELDQGVNKLLLEGPDHKYLSLCRQRGKIKTIIYVLIQQFQVQSFQMILSLRTVERWEAGWIWPQQLYFVSPWVRHKRKWEGDWGGERVWRVGKRS